MFSSTRLAAFLTLVALFHGSPLWGAAPFAIEIVDEETDRGVPLVELRTTSQLRFYTDSAGLVAIDDPALLDRRVHFEVRTFGYEFPADGFGIRGRALDLKPGGHATLKIKRINIAERLYRVTGEGIYRDSLLAGREAPLKQPLLNAQVVGQDSVQPVIYRDKLYFFWGDTNRQSYPLGLFAMAGATAALPSQGGLDPAVGVDLNYFTDEAGFARGMAPVAEPGAVWVEGVFTVKDDTGRERMLGHFSRMESLAKRLERGLMLYDDEAEKFVRFKPLSLDAPLAPTGKPFQVEHEGKSYWYFADPYPCIRVANDWQSVQDHTAYEGFTPLRAGARYDERDPALERNSNGELVFDWKANTPPLTASQLRSLVDAKKIRAEESPLNLVDVARGKPVVIHGGSVYWNEFRKRWIAIFVEQRGQSYLGEVWYAEARQPEGPWRKTVKIATHHLLAEGLGKVAVNMDFYNPTQHPFFDQQGGRIVYFEGTYTSTFSGTPTPTPRYDYNQLMYRLDLADPRLKAVHDD